MRRFSRIAVVLPVALALVGCGATHTVTHLRLPTARAGRPLAALPSPPVRLTAAQRRTFVAGEVVLLQTGCEGCHEIGDAGNNGPGPPLTHIGTRRGAAAISAALRNPTAPMPSFAQLARTSPRKFRALVRFLAMLR